MRAMTACIAITCLALGAPAMGESMPDVDLARAEEIVGGRCFLCHGMDGESTTALYPRLAGQHYQYVVKQLADFKAGRRQSDTMVDMAKDLSDEEMTALGVYFEKKPTRAAEVEDPELAAVGRYIFQRGNEFSGVPACASCHGEQGHGTAKLPRLAGQVGKYTEKQLKSFNERQRTNDNAVMHSIASKLTALEIRAVATYISTLE
jgi:cytochrome c553